MEQKREVTMEQRIDHHNKAVAKVMQLIEKLDSAVPHTAEDCAAKDFCKWDAMKALLAGKANATQQEIGAMHLADAFLNSDPMMMLLVTALTSLGDPKDKDASSPY